LAADAELPSGTALLREHGASQVLVLALHLRP